MNRGNVPIIKREHEKAAVGFLSSLVCFKEDATILLYSDPKRREELMSLYAEHGFTKAKIQRIRKAIRTFQMCGTREEVEKAALKSFRSSRAH